MRVDVNKNLTDNRKRGFNNQQSTNIAQTIGGGGMPMPVMGRQGISWQMPQGGINLGETPSAAALREMAEEIGSNQGKIIAESKKWYSYRLPPFLVHKLWEGKYCGQRQKWFLIRFTGQDSDINVKTKHPEFDSWQWVEVHELLENIIPFKYKLYSKIIAEFKELIM